MNTREFTESVVADFTKKLEADLDRRNFSLPRDQVVSMVKLGQAALRKKTRIKGGQSGHDFDQKGSDQG